MEDNKLEIERVKNRVKDLERKHEECCSKQDIEEKAKTVWLLESIKEKVDGLVKDRDKMLEVLNFHSKLLYIGMGILVALEFLGAGERIKALFGAG